MTPAPQKRVVSVEIVLPSRDMLFIDLDERCRDHAVVSIPSTTFEPAVEFAPR